MALSTIQNNSFADTAVHGYRNLIINGAMQVAQWSTSTTIPEGTETYGTDRWYGYANSIDELVLTMSQDTDAPAGFAASTKLTTSTAESALAADEYSTFTQKIEGQNLQNLAFGTSDAQSFTLSFWVKSSLTGTFAVSFYKPNGSEIIGSTYTINSANTWEYKTITIVGNTGSSIVNDNTAGLWVTFTLAAGSDWTSTDNTSWGSYANGKWSYGQTQNGLITTLNATWQITGVQLEVGSEATPFEHRSYGDELARCQRYYYEINYSGAALRLGWGHSAASTQCRMHFQTPVPMRATPTFSSTNVGYRDNGDVNVGAVSSPVLNSYEGTTYKMQFTVSGATAGTAGELRTTAAGATTFDAEL